MEYWSTELKERKEQGRLLSSRTLKKHEDFARGAQELFSSSKLTHLQLTQLNVRVAN